MTGLPLSAVELYLRGRGLMDTYPDTIVVRGTGSADDLAELGPAGHGIILSAGGGAGFYAEWTFDQPILTVRTLGLQRDPDDGQQFAADVDRMLLADRNVDIGGLRALYVTRAGGGPTLIQVDAARRHHYSCSYVVPVASGL